jgi:hypothetical protein
LPGPKEINPKIPNNNIPTSELPLKNVGLRLQNINVNTAKYTPSGNNTNDNIKNILLEKFGMNL